LSATSNQSSRAGKKNLSKRCVHTLGRFLFLKNVQNKKSIFEKANFLKKSIFEKANFSEKVIFRNLEFFKKSIEFE
jgi:hypothetical protein